MAKNFSRVTLPFTSIVWMGQYPTAFAYRGVNGKSLEVVSQYTVRVAPWHAVSQSVNLFEG